MQYFSSGSEIVDQIGQMNIVGNMIPAIWNKTIVNDKGKTQYLAITILADIVYWYKPEEVRDERSGMVIGWRKKFRADLLQRSIKALMEEYDESERTIFRALGVLEDLKVIRRHRRTIQFKNGIIARNVLFLELVPEALYNLTYPKEEDIRKKSKPAKADAEPYEVLEDKLESESDSNKAGNSSKKAPENSETGTDLDGRELTAKSENMNCQKCESELPNLSVHFAKNGSPLRQKWQSTSADLSPHFGKNGSTNTENTLETTEENTIYPSIHNTDGMDGEDGSSEPASYSIPKPSPEEIRKIYRRLIAKNIDLDFYMNDPNRNNKEMFQQFLKVNRALVTYTISRRK